MYRSAHELPGWYRTFVDLTPAGVWLSSPPGRVPEADELARLVASLPDGAAMERGEAGFKERVDFGEFIGIFVDRLGRRFPATIGIIHCAADESIRIVPGRPLP